MYNSEIKTNTVQGQDSYGVGSSVINVEQFKRNCNAKANQTFSILLPKKTPSIGALYSPSMVSPIIDFMLVFSGGEFIQGNAEGQNLDKESIRQFHENGEYIEVLFNCSKKGGVLIEDYNWMTQPDDVSQDWVYMLLRVVINVHEKTIGNMIFFHDFKSGKNTPQILRTTEEVYKMCKGMVQNMVRVRE